MNRTLSAIFAACVTTASYGQGLLSIGQIHDFDNDLPFSVTVASSVGWDSNMNTSSVSEQDSTYWQNGVSVYVPIVKGKTDWLNLGAHYSNIWYADAAPGTEDVYHNARVTLDFQKSLSPRLSIANSLYGAYEAEPDYFIGASVNRRQNQYFYGYNNLALSYQWSPRLSTTSSYTISTIAYDDEAFQANDSVTHLFGNQFRYSLSRQTAATLDYRYSYTDYDSGSEATSHYLLVGADHSFSQQRAGSLRVGAQFRNFESAGSDSDATAPYLEGAINYRMGKRTSLRWFHYLGYDESDFGGQGETYSYRTGVSASHQFNDRLTANVDLHYIHVTSDGFAGLDGVTDDTLAFSVGFDYRLWRNVSLTGGYSVSNVSSDDSLREYDRQRVNIGLSATF